MDSPKVYVVDTVVDKDLIRLVMEGHVEKTKGIQLITTEDLEDKINSENRIEYPNLLFSDSEVKSYKKKSKKRRVKPNSKCTCGSGRRFKNCCSVRMSNVR